MKKDILELIRAAEAVQGEFVWGKDFSAGSVAAAVRCQNRKIYTGICLDLACGIGFCAEHAAIAEMLKDRQTRIEAVVAVSGQGIVPPCGRCRELMVQIDLHNLCAEVVVSRARILLLRRLLPEPWLLAKAGSSGMKGREPLRQKEGLGPVRRRDGRTR